MKTVRVTGQIKPEGDWVHRFRNFGEDVYVQLRDGYDVSLEEIDAAFDTFRIRHVPPERASSVADSIALLLREHHLDDSVFAVIDDAEHPSHTVVLIVDTAFGERLWDVALHDTWVIPSAANRAAVEAMWERQKQRDIHHPSLSVWSNPMTVVTEKGWLSMLQTIDMHHAPFDTLSVYGAAPTPAITAALREYGYNSVRTTALGFLARRSL